MTLASAIFIHRPPTLSLPTWGVGAAGRPGGENAVDAVVGGRLGEQVVAFVAVEDPQDEEVGEALDVREARLKLGQDLERALHLVAGPQALGDLSGREEGGPSP